MLNEQFPPRRPSIIWDAEGHYRNLPWREFKSEVDAVPGGIGVAATDFSELMEYRGAPFREKTWVLRETATELLAARVRRMTFACLPGSAPFSCFTTVTSMLAGCWSG